MVQDKADSKSYVDAIKDMPSAKKAFLGAASMAPLSRALTYAGPDLNEIFMLIVVVAIVGFIGLVGLMVIVVKEDSLRVKNDAESDPLRILFIIAAIFAILGEVIFAKLSILACIMVIVLTVIRERKDGDVVSAKSGEVVKNSSGLL